MEIKQTLTYIFTHRYTYYSLYYPLLASLALVIFISLVVITSASIRISHAPKGIPWAGLQDKKLLPKLRACLRELTARRKPIHGGYEEFSENGKPFIVPGLHWNTVILPPSNTAWLASQPENVLSGNAVLDEAMGLAYLAHGPNVASVRDFTVIRRDLTRQSTKLAREVLEEIQLTFDAELGSDTETWKEVRAMELMRTVAFCAANRIFVGPLLCRRKDYRARIERWVTTYGICTLVMRFLIPTLWKPLFMRVVAVPVQVFRWFATREIRSEIRRRLGGLAAGDGEDGAREGEGGEEEQKKEKRENGKNDMLQWIISHNTTKPNPEELLPANIAGKSILFNLFATGTTSAMSCLVLQDILHYADAPNLLAELHGEAAQYVPLISQSLATEGGLGTGTATTAVSASLHSFAKLDSTIRESLHPNPLGAQALTREVVAAEGAKTPDGLFLPKGTHVAVNLSAARKDTEFSPLRWWRQGRDGNRDDDGDGDSDPHGKMDVRGNKSQEQQQKTKQNQRQKQTLAVQVSPEFLSFGLGKHACPGRFFALNAMKMILGYLLREFELQPAEGEKLVWEVGEAVVPSDKWVVKVRRRRGEKKEKEGEEGGGRSQ